MNIPSIESLLAELDKYKRAYESADRQILSLKEQRNRLTAERDELKAQWAYYQDFCKSHNAKGITDLVVQRDDWKKECNIQRNLRIGVEAVFDTLNEDIGRLKAERDAALAENVAYYQLAKKEVWAVAESALREAKEALVMNIVGTGGRTPAAHNAIATINKVLGKE